MLMSAIVMSLGISAFASQIEPRVVGPCPLYGIHRMYTTSGLVHVDVYNSSGQLIANNFQEYNCACGEPFVCEGSPGVENNPVGRYFFNHDIHSREIQSYLPLLGYVMKWQSYRSAPRGEITTPQTDPAFEGYTFYQGTRPYPE
jgi:hypothetical protein